MSIMFESLRKALVDLVPYFRALTTVSIRIIFHKTHTVGILLISSKILKTYGNNSDA